MIDRDMLRAFVKESNHIEGIIREPTEDEVGLSLAFLSLRDVSVINLEEVVSVYQPDAVLRDRPGLDVRVGYHIAPSGGPAIATALAYHLRTMVVWSPYKAHKIYEDLHPFTDGNGRSGRILWLWMMKQRDGRLPPLGFLHTWYYQSLG